MRRIREASSLYVKSGRVLLHLYKEGAKDDQPWRALSYSDQERKRTLPCDIGKNLRTQTYVSLLACSATALETGGRAMNWTAIVGFLRHRLILPLYNRWLAGTLFS